VSRDVAREVGTIADILSSGSVAEMRKRLGAWLGLDRPVSEAVLTAALVHRGYARRLTVARPFPDAVESLLARPPDLPPSAARLAGVAGEHPDHRTTALLQRLATSVIQWSASGFALADKATTERRWAACQACPHLVIPPRKAVYLALRLVRPEARICALCGCVASAKVRMQHERCPDRHPTSLERTRWEDPFEESPDDTIGNRPGVATFSGATNPNTKNEEARESQTKTKE
jgi:hypothetical protein